MIQSTASRSHTRPARRGNILIGCAVVVVLGIVALIGAGIWVGKSWKGWVASGTHKVIDQTLIEAQIDPIERQEILVHIDDLMARFEQGDVTFEQLGDVLEAFADSPLTPTLMVAAAEKLYITDSELSDEEKADAHTQLTRYAFGLSQERIDPDSIDTVIETIEDDTPDGTGYQISTHINADGSASTRELKTQAEVTTEDLQAMITRARELADEAGIEETPTPIDLSDEVQKVIDIGLNGPPQSAQTGNSDMPEEEASTEEQPGGDRPETDPANPEPEDGP